MTQPHFCLSIWKDMITRHQYYWCFIKSPTRRLDPIALSVLWIMTMTMSMSMSTLAHANEVARIEQAIAEKIDTQDTSLALTLLLENKNGDRFEYSALPYPRYHVYFPDSTSKWVTTTIILSLVERGLLSLDDRPADLLADRLGWPQTGNLAQIKLRHLLSLTSGLTQEPLCGYMMHVNLDVCVKRALEMNRDTSELPQYAPGYAFHYRGPHFQVAGLMAIEALQREHPEKTISWQSVFNDFRARTGLFRFGQYIFPSAINPQLGGGLAWMPYEYHAMLRALFHGEILSPVLLDAMLGDQTAATVDDPNREFGMNPMYQGYAIGNFHYGFGNWVERKLNEAGEWVPSGRNSSGGLFGSYPFMHRDAGYFGVLARQGMPATFDEAYAFFLTLEPLIEQWTQVTLGKY